MPVAGLSKHGIPHKLKHTLKLICIFTMVIYLAGCQAEQVIPTIIFSASTARATHEQVTPDSEPATPASSRINANQTAPAPEVYPTYDPMASPNPLRIVYPTEGSEPISAWRPPLYPTPWAPTMFDHFFFTSPIAANEVNSPVADYRYGGLFFQDVVHTGIDIPAPIGTPVIAAGSGTVIWAGYGIYRGGADPTDPYGLAVSIQHDFGYQDQPLFTIYGHMSEIDVVEGQHVETGDLLGLVGETGKVTGPHLHFEVRVGENNFFATRNPELWLVPSIGWGIIAGQVTNTGGQLISDQQIIITDPKISQNYFAWSYGKTSANSDAYYQENLVIGNMPAGTYLLRTAFGGVSYKAQIEVSPGVVNYFTFHGFNGFSIEEPPNPGIEFTPAPLENPAP